MRADEEVALTQILAPTRLYVLIRFIAFAMARRQPPCGKFDALKRLTVTNIRRRIWRLTTYGPQYSAPRSREPVHQRPGPQCPCGRPQQCVLLPCRAPRRSGRMNRPSADQGPIAQTGVFRDIDYFHIPGEGMTALMLLSVKYAVSCNAARRQRLDNHHVVGSPSRVGRVAIARPRGACSHSRRLPRRGRARRHSGWRPAVKPDPRPSPKCTHRSRILPRTCRDTPRWTSRYPMNRRR
jgi:hypothetical protein